MTPQKPNIPDPESLSTTDANYSRDSLLSPRELAAFLKITPQGLCNIRRKGKITPIIASGRIIRYRLGDVISALAPKG